MDGKRDWKKGYFPKELLLLQKKKAFKISTPKYSEYEGYFFWLPSSFVRAAVPYKEDYYLFFLPDNFEVELRLEKDNKIVAKRSVSSSYLQRLFQKLTKEITEALGIEYHKYDIVDIASIKRLLFDMNTASAWIAKTANLSRQTIDKIRSDIAALENMKLRNLRSLQRAVVLKQKEGKTNENE